MHEKSESKQINLERTLIFNENSMTLKFNQKRQKKSFSNESQKGHSEEFLDIEIQKYNPKPCLRNAPISQPHHQVSSLLLTQPVTVIAIHPVSCSTIAATTIPKSANASIRPKKGFEITKIQ